MIGFLIALLFAGGPKIVSPVAASPLHISVTVIAHASMVNLPHDPVVLIPAPDATHVIVPVAAVAQFNDVAPYGSFSPFGSEAAWRFVLGQTEDTSWSGVEYFFTRPAGTPTRYVMSRLPWLDGAAPSDLTAGQPLSLGLWNVDNDPIPGGDPANTLTVSVTYYLLNTSTGQFE